MNSYDNYDDSGASLSNAGLDAGSCVVAALEICAMKRFGNEPMQSVFARLLKDKGVPMVGMILPKLDPRYVLERTQDFETGNDVFRWWPKAANIS